MSIVLADDVAAAKGPRLKKIELKASSVELIEGHRITQGVKTAVPVGHP